MARRNERTVYSTGPDGAQRPRVDCPHCGGSPCRCERTRAPEDQAPRVRRERSGRKGKTVTVVEPILLTRADATALLKTLKSACGSGGTLKPADEGFALEIQGDHADRITERLCGLGYRAKRSGG